MYFSINCSGKCTANNSNQGGKSSVPFIGSNWLRPAVLANWPTESGLAVAIELEIKIKAESNDHGTVRIKLKRLGMNTVTQAEVVKNAYLIMVKEVPPG
jgi:hypothetical protein